mgnify:FL=1
MKTKFQKQKFQIPITNDHWNLEFLFLEFENLIRYFTNKFDTH